jgi:hypothetical protein
MQDPCKECRVKSICNWQGTHILCTLYKNFRLWQIRQEKINNEKT